MVNRLSFMSNVQSLLFPLIELAIGSKFWSLYRQGRAYDCTADSSRSDIQHGNAQRLLRHAIQNVPLWRDRFLADQSTWLDRPQSEMPNLFLDLPVTSKADIRTGFPEKVTSDGAREHWRFGNSAGTVDRVTVVSDFEKRDYLRATNLRISNAIVGNPLGSRIVEIPPDACNVVCALRDEGPLELKTFVLWALKKGILFKRETRPDLRGRLERSWIVRQDTLEPLAAKAFDDLIPQLDLQLERIAAARPNILRGLPLYLLWLAERATQKNLKFPTLKAILPYGGLMSEAMAARVSAAMGAPFYDFYGTSEIGAIALQHPGEDGMRVFDDLVLVEVVDNQNRPLPPGQPGRILVTDFHNYAMPLIRYSIEDWGCWLSDDLSTTDPFQLCRNARLKVLGRHVETTRLPSGRLVSARDIMNTLFEDDAILNACVEGRQAGQFTLKYAAGSEIKAATVKNLQSLLEVTDLLRVRPVSYLRPEISGKYQIFKAAMSSDYASD